jgi:hypothetical protein
MIDHRLQQQGRDDMKLAFIFAMALAILAAGDSASASPRKNGQQVNLGKGAATKATRFKASTSAKGVPSGASQGFIMGDGRICNPKWGC